MKTLPLKNWELNKDLDCLLFFAQRSSELLFDYTLDSYKYPALYSATIINEAIEIIDKIESNETSEKSLEPILDELKWKLQRDDIVKLILNENLQDYLSFDNNNFEDIRIKLELLYNKIRPEKYIKKCYETIKNLVKENKKKKAINKIIPHLFSALIGYGYSQGFLYVQTLKFFFYRGEKGDKINSTDIIDEYFKFFSLKSTKHLVIFKGGIIFSEIKESCQNININILESFTAVSLATVEAYFINSKKQNELFIACGEINALDPQSAKTQAESKINKFTKLFTYFHHKKQPWWSEQALIYEQDSNTFLGKINKQTSPMHKCFDLYPPKAAVKLGLLIKNFRLESKSFYKFDKAVELHGISLSSKHSENQLLQNWIAFETLLVGYSKESKISQVLNTLVPALKLNYLSRIVATLADDLMLWDKDQTQSYLGEIDYGNNILEKTAALISIEDNLAIRKKFYNALKDFPLLKFRIFYLQEIFKNPKNIYEYYSFHEKKLIWQLKRIYRTRNLIVHTGYVPDFTDILIENSHIYLDSLLNQMIDLVIEDRLISNIRQGIMEIQILQKKHEKYLEKEINNEITKENFYKLIFGYSTFANTWYDQ